MQYCTNCGKQISYDLRICDDCSSQPTLKSRPFADPTESVRFGDPFQTQPLGQPPSTQQMQPFVAAHGIQNQSNCPYCGGAAGIMPRSTISTGGFVYMGIMFTITSITFLIFFPCALIPFALIFLGLLFKETNFACINCGQKIS